MMKNLRVIFSSNWSNSLFTLHASYRFRCLGSTVPRGEDGYKWIKCSHKTKSIFVQYSVGGRGDTYGDMLLEVFLLHILPVGFRCSSMYVRTLIR